MVGQRNAGLVEVALHLATQIFVARCFEIRLYHFGGVVAGLFAALAELLGRPEAEELVPAGVRLEAKLLIEREFGLFARFPLFESAQLRPPFSSHNLRPSRYSPGRGVLHPCAGQRCGLESHKDLAIGKHPPQQTGCNRETAPTPCCRGCYRKTGSRMNRRRPDPVAGWETRDGQAPQDL